MRRGTDRIQTTGMRVELRNGEVQCRPRVLCPAVPGTALTWMIAAAACILASTSNCLTHASCCEWAELQCFTPSGQSNPTKKLKLQLSPLMAQETLNTDNWRVGRHVHSWMLKPRHHLHRQPLFFIPLFPFPSSLWTVGQFNTPALLPCLPSACVPVPETIAFPPVWGGRAQDAAPKRLAGLQTRISSSPIHCGCSLFQRDAEAFNLGLINSFFLRR